MKQAVLGAGLYTDAAVNAGKRVDFPILVFSGYRNALGRAFPGAYPAKGAVADFIGQLSPGIFKAGTNFNGVGACGASGYKISENIFNHLSAPYS